MSKSKAKGTWAESALREYFRLNGWPGAKRNALAGAKDEGDLDIHPKIVIEIKNRDTLSLPKWMAETEEERKNAGAKYGILLVKPRGVGERRMGMWHALMPMDQVRTLLAECNPVLTTSPPEHVETWLSVRLEWWLNQASKVASLNNHDIYYVSWKPRGYTMLDDSGYFCGMHVISLMKMLSAAGYRPEISREG